MSGISNGTNQDKPKKTLNLGQSGPAKIKPKYGVIKNVIGVISGKGGVGKSTVTGILASTLRKKGYKTINIIGGYEEYLRIFNQ